MRYLLLAVILVATAVPVYAQGAVVLCQGNICGGGGIRNYQYDVTVSEGLIYQFHVGTCDPNIADYSNILMPAGWTFGIFSILEDHADTFTPHGQISTPTGQCQWCAVWTDSTGQGTAGALFGYDNPNLPHDVGWFINSSTAVENWSAAVGMGSGPVHGPTVPEPMSMFGLLGGLGMLGGIAVRRRR